MISQASTEDPRYIRIAHGDRVKVATHRSDVYLEIIEAGTRIHVLAVLTGPEALELAEDLEAAAVRTE